MKLKKLFALLLALAMVLALAACGGNSNTDSDNSESEGTESETEEPNTDGTETEEPGDTDASNTWDYVLADGEVWADLDYEKVDLSGKTIGYVTINSAAPWGGRVGTKLEEYAKACGATVKVLDANTDANLLDQYCQQMVDSGVDALCVFGGTPANMSAMAKTCSDAGIPMFLCALDADSAADGYEYVTAMIGPDQKQMCANIANYVVSQNGADYTCNVYEVNGVPFLQDYIDRNAGFQGYMADYPSYTLAGIEDCYSDRTTAKTVTENWISAGLKAGDIIMGYDDDLTMGAVQALDEAGLTGQVKVYSLTGQSDAIQAVLDGDLELTVMNRADSIAAGTVTAMGEYFSTGSTARFHRTELVYITAENAAEYLNQAEF